MKRYNGLTPEEPTRVTEIQDSLRDRYVEQEEALEKGKKTAAIEIEFEIKELQREKEKIEQRATAVW